MRVLGIDPGTRKTGWGIVEKRGTRLRAVASGVICVDGRRPLPERLRIIHRDLSTVFTTYAPGAVALEDMFFAKYANAAMKLGHARGVAMLAGAQFDLVVSEYPPALVKRTVAGKGNASKQQVGRLVGAILGLSDLPGEDATDALAVAITHLQAAVLPIIPARPRVTTPK
jgi:crossover junction endodeoxyribonuclease RuvC